MLIITQASGFGTLRCLYPNYLGFHFERGILDDNLRHLDAAFDEKDTTRFKRLDNPEKRLGVDVYGFASVRFHAFWL